MPSNERDKYIEKEKDDRERRKKQEAFQKESDFEAF